MEPTEAVNALEVAFRELIRLVWGNQWIAHLDSTTDEINLHPQDANALPDPLTRGQHESRAIGNIGFQRDIVGVKGGEQTDPLVQRQSTGLLPGPAFESTRVPNRVRRDRSIVDGESKDA